MSQIETLSPLNTTTHTDKCTSIPSVDDNREQWIDFFSKIGINFMELANTDKPINRYEMRSTVEQFITSNDLDYDQTEAIIYNLNILSSKYLSKKKQHTEYDSDYEEN